MYIFPCQGMLSVEFDTEQFPIEKEDVLATFDYSDRVSAEHKFNVFKESNYALLKMFNLAEFDEYKGDVIAEALTDLTKFGSTSKVQEQIAGQVYTAYFGIDRKVDQKLTQQNKNTHTNNLRQAYKPKL